VITAVEQLLEVEAGGDSLSKVVSATDAAKHVFIALIALSCHIWINLETIIDVFQAFIVMTISLSSFDRAEKIALLATAQRAKLAANLRDVLYLIRVVKLAEVVPLGVALFITLRNLL